MCDLSLLIQFSRNWFIRQDDLDKPNNQSDIDLNQIRLQSELWHPHCSNTVHRRSNM